MNRKLLVRIIISSFVLTIISIIIFRQFSARLVFDNIREVIIFDSDLIHELDTQEFERLASKSKYVELGITKGNLYKGVITWKDGESAEIQISSIPAVIKITKNDKVNSYILDKNHSVEWFEFIESSIRDE